MSERVSSRAALVGGLLLWFAVLGGALSWAVHSLAAWSIDELACEAGHDDLAGVPLVGAIALAVLLPAAGATAALVVSVLAWRRLRPEPREDGDRATGRAHLLAVVGLWLNLLALAMIVFGGVAALVLPPCQR
ncbi:hypothetical protein [Micromonospora sp. HM5-17]|jgi:hypothetical protein|uniref:hypothetical protein n=1 Tax=Micromonospora sp. HM5-17 TaxID=2487710 RepID=UPI000F49DFDC|nr:hypothetical protein [Micromonospora sp. HM5-17]ROT28182.1 hypothetical protein EF879_21460 [Micromonospora sp. HM5-17]